MQADTGRPQNIPLLRKALAINDTDAVDEFISRYQIHNNSVDNQATDTAKLQ